MFRSISIVGLIALCFAGPMLGQDASLEGYFAGKQVVVKIDTRSQKGVDLKFNKPVAMDWNDYSSRIKSYGVAIHKGDVARVTKFVVKSDMIEFQLNGGGFGTAGDDTNTTVSATVMPRVSTRRIWRSRYPPPPMRRRSRTCRGTWIRGAFACAGTAGCAERE